MYIMDIMWSWYSFLTGVKVLSYHGDSCVVDVAPSNRPYIDRVHNQLGGAIAGNGYAAKSSDEIGRLAVELLIGGQWDIDIPQNLFHVQLKSGCGCPTSRFWSTLHQRLLMILLYSHVQIIQNNFFYSYRVMWTQFSGRTWVPLYFKGII